MLRVNSLNSLTLPEFSYSFIVIFNRFLIAYLCCTMGFCCANDLPPLFDFYSAPSPTLPKEVLRHVYQNIGPNRKHPLKFQGAHIAIPTTVFQNDLDTIYFSVNSTDLFPSGLGENSHIIEVVQKNTGKSSHNNRPFIWFVAPGDGQGRGSMWKGCELAIFAAKQHRKNNSKKRWNFLRAIQPSCVIDLITRILSKNSQGLIIYAALSNSKPRIPARQARIFVNEKSRDPESQRQRIKSSHHPFLMFASYYSSSKSAISSASSFPVKSTSPPATVSTQYAIDFLLGRHDDQQVVRLTRALPLSSSSSREKTKRLASPSAFQDGLSYVPNLCTRQPLVTRVEDVGLQNYIVFPRHFDIGQCSGACVFPLTHDVNPRTHTVVQLLHNLSEPDRVPAPNCVPVSFRPVSLLVRKPDNSLAVETFHDLIVQSCGCR